MAKQIRPPTAKKDAALKRIYYGDSPGAFRGPKALWKEAIARGYSNISFADVKRFLMGQEVYTRYRPARRNYERNKIIANYSGEIVQLDIMDMSKYAASNDGVRYAILGYDTYSKYAIGCVISNRKPDSILRGLDYLLRELPFQVNAIYWDREGGWMSKAVQGWLKSQGIHNYSTTAKTKAPSAERYI